jgi:hypothetical protein
MQTNKLLIEGLMGRAKELTPSMKRSHEEAAEGGTNIFCTR